MRFHCEISSPLPLVYISLYILVIEQICIILQQNHILHYEKYFYIDVQQNSSVAVLITIFVCLQIQFLFALVNRKQAKKPKTLHTVRVTVTLQC